VRPALVGALTRHASTAASGSAMLGRFSLLMDRPAPAHVSLIRRYARAMRDRNAETAHHRRDRLVGPRSEHTESIIAAARLLADHGRDRRSA
jgi:hypothetical protein